MKLSKKVLSMVVCGLVVLGGSQATLVKANALVATIVPGNDHYSPTWQQGVRFGMQSKACPGIKDGWSMNFTFKEGCLTLDGPTNVGCTWTFGDKFVLGWEKANGEKGHTVFRTGGGSAASALSRAREAFNNARIHVNDKIYVYGDSWDTSVTFPGKISMIKGVTGNNYRKGYDSRFIDKYTAGFCVKERWLQEAIVHHGRI